jgi:hypothetical protein
MAQNNLGVMYYNGYGVSQNYKEAFKWYIKAAEQGIALAQYNLGAMYANGDGVTQDFKEAYKWMLIASMNGKEVGKLKQDLASQITSAQIVEAQKLAKEFVAKQKKENID